MKYIIFLLLMMLPVFASPQQLTDIRDEHLAQMLANMVVLADDADAGNSYKIRVIEVPAEFGQCSGSIMSCPDVELYIVVAANSTQMEPHLYKLPNAKGWKFDNWSILSLRGSGCGANGKGNDIGLILETALPNANIDPRERRAWKSTIYDILIAPDCAEISSTH
jgi:hypothetical protein